MYCLGVVVSYTCNITQQWEGFLEWSLVTPKYGRERIHFDERSMEESVKNGTRYPELSIHLLHNQFDGGNWYFMESRAEIRMSPRLQKGRIICHYDSHARFLFLGIIVVTLLPCSHDIVVDLGRVGG